MPDPNTDYVASVPLQYYFVDKDTGAPLSAGVVSFFSDPDFNIPKNVYEQSLNPLTGEITYEVLRNPLVLSSVGTFIDDSGNNLTPFYWPFDSTPGSADVGNLQLYFITVYSSTGVFQFSLNEWPPNAEANAIINGAVATTPSILTNPNFSVVLFNPPTSFVYNVSGSGTRTPLAPGWDLLTEGTGAVTVTQNSLGQQTPGMAPYSLGLASTGITSLSVVQRLANSPRILDASIIAGYLDVQTSQSVQISMFYNPSSGSPNSYIIFSQAINTVNEYESVTGTVEVSGINGADASGYVDIIINIGITNSVVSITSAQIVSVAAEGDAPAFIQSTTQEQLNGLMWYYEPQLAFKPIPSYAIGWDFGFNPCQALGQSVGVSGLGANLSRYIADQTIAFESTGNAMSYTFSSSGLRISTATSTSFALIQYLDTNTAFELLANRNSVALRGAATTALPFQINLYWTGGSIPNVTAGSNLSLVTAVGGTGAVTTGNGSTWNLVPRTIGVAGGTLAVGYSMYSFNGWDATAVNTSGATYFAIVVSFGTLLSTSPINLSYISLCAGDIATQPAPLNQAQTLDALQYYYEKTYDNPVLPGASSSNLGSALIATQATAATGGTAFVYPTSFNVTYNTVKRASPTITLYSDDGSSGFVNSFLYGNAVQVGSKGKIAIASWTPSSSGGTKSTNYIVASGSAMSSGATAAIDLSGYIIYQATYDARFGVV